MEKNKEKEKNSGGGSRVKTLRAEFKKIFWPDRKTVFKESVAVIVSAVCLGLLIAVLDAIIKFGFGFIIR